MQKGGRGRRCNRRNRCNPCNRCNRDDAATEWRREKERRRAQVDEKAAASEEWLKQAKLRAQAGSALWAPYDQPQPIYVERAEPQRLHGVRRAAAPAKGAMAGASDRTLHPCRHANPMRF